MTDCGEGAGKDMEEDLTRAAWRKSSYSGGSGNCVEVVGRPGFVGVRDSKDPGGPALVLTLTAWRAFASRMKSSKLG